MSKTVHNRRQFLACAMAPAAMVLPGASARAQATYPNRPVRIIIPFPAGGAADFGGRSIGNALAARWGQPVVFENRAGAGSTIGTEVGVKSTPDGYTLVLGIPAGIAIAPHIYPRLPYDPLKDLMPIAGFATSPLVLVVPADSPYRSVAELVAAAQARPGAISYASNGSGSLPHLTTEWFASQAGIQLLHVPYRGSAVALPDLVAGRTDMMMDIIVSSLPLVEAGRLRALAVTAPAPTTRLPGVPTVAASGFPGFDADQWYGLFAPAGTPAAIVSQIAADMRAATASTTLRGQMWQRGAEIRYSDTAAFSALVGRDWQRWQQVAQATGARVE